MRKLFILLNVAFVALNAFASDLLKTLTLEQAHEIALRNHPRISAADLKALAAKQRQIQVRAAYFPTVVASATAVGTSDDNTRIAAGAINNPSIFDRNAEGVLINQIITDFGRTANLNQSSKLHTRAEQTNAVAVREQILFEVDTAYYSALEAKSVLRVAEQTIANRQLLMDQVSALASNKIKSDLDVNLASVSLQEGELLRLRATNDLQAAFAYLSALLGEGDIHYELLDERATPPSLGNVNDLIQTALANKPELVALRLEHDAALKFERAENDLHLPTVSAVAAAGWIPIHGAPLKSQYAAAGVNMSLPLFAGGAYSARAKEAHLQAERAGEALREAENNTIRDVRIAWQNAQYASERAQLTSKLFDTAQQAFNLARARYKVGSTSMIEVSQTQLNATSAEIVEANAKYELFIQIAKLRFQSGQML